jgi:hypothetical protein
MFKRHLPTGAYPNAGSKKIIRRRRMINKNTKKT